MTDTKPPDELAARRKPGPKPGRKHTSPLGAESGSREVIAKQRQSRAIQLRIAGVSLAAIAEEVGYATPSGAHQAVMAGLRTILPDELRDDARRLELAKLDRLEQANWTSALRGDEKAATVILRCIDTRSKLLGLHAPAQVDVRVREGEMVRVEILEMLNDETMKALEPFQEEMIRLSELRGGVIDVEAEEEAT